MKIPFNIPFSSELELKYINEAVSSGHLSGNGPFTKRCHSFFENNWKFGKCFLTTSCTDALEMAAMLIDIQPGDEIIVPAYTFVSTALAFTRQGATIVFADSREQDPCIDEKKIEKLITPKTKAIVPVHYGGKVCDMDKITDLSQKYHLLVVEDAAHAFGSRYKGRPAGTIGHLGCFSFHETKVIHCGEGGMLVINDKRFAPRAEIVWEKGTNRSEFQRGETSFYEWKDTGSSFLMSELNAAFLFGQLEKAKEILRHRRMQWELYYNQLEKLVETGVIRLPFINNREDYNYSSFYLLTRNLKERNNLKDWLISADIQAITHYLDLSSSTYIKKTGNVSESTCKKNCIRYEETLLRLPLFHNLTEKDIKNITEKVVAFYKILLD